MTASLRNARALGFLVAAALTAACGGPGAPPSVQSAAPAVAAPDARTGNLMYVADLNANDVFVFSYPGGVLKRTLTGFQAVHYECVDGDGHVFVDDTGASKVLEYDRNGSKPIHTFKTPGNTPNSCAIDPTTGDLAISYNPLGDGPGAVDVYKHATGKPTTYTTPNVFRYYFIGYDNAGNLFIDGTDMHVAFELPNCRPVRTARKRLTSTSAFRCRALSSGTASISPSAIKSASSVRRRSIALP